MIESVVFIILKLETFIVGTVSLNKIGQAKNNIFSHFF